MREPVEQEKREYHRNYYIRNRVKMCARQRQYRLIKQYKKFEIHVAKLVETLQTLKKNLPELEVKQKPVSETKVVQLEKPKKKKETNDPNYFKVEFYN